MSEAISSEDISLIKKQHPRLYFIIGSFNSTMKVQCYKLVTEFKYGYICLHSLIEKEIKSDSALSAQLKELKEKQEKIPSEILCKMLVNEIISLKKSTILIQGYPKTLEDALYFEKNIYQITTIINFINKEEKCLKRHEEICIRKGKEYNEEGFKKKYKKRESEIKEISNFYSKYGIVKEINADKSMSDITTEFKQCLYPTIYSIIGKRYSGKTELSKVLNTKQGIKLIDFNEFKNKPNIVKHKSDDEFIVYNFITLLRKEESQRVLIENFPENKLQYTYFINNCKPFETIYYLNAANSSCFERRNELNITDCNYIDCSELNDLLYEFEQKDNFLKYLKRQTIPLKIKDENGYFVEIKEAPPKPKPKPAEGEEAPKVVKEEPIDLTNKKLILSEIDVNNHKILIINNIIQQVQPFTVIIKSTEENEENRKNVCAQLVSKYQFEIIDINEVVDNAKKRNVICNEEEINSYKMIELIRPLLYKENCKRYILENFPKNLEQVNLFEKEICSINKLIYISNDKELSNIQNESAIEVYFKNNNKLFILPVGDIKPFQVDECLNVTRDINIVYGMPLSGKSSFAKHLKLKHNFLLLDFPELIKLLKTKKAKSDPENAEADPESMEISFDELLEGLKSYLETESKNKRIIIDNFFIPGGAEPFLVDTVDKAKKVLNTIGKFRNLYEIKCDETTLINRYKTKEGIAEEINEEQKAAFDESLKNPSDLLNLIKTLSANTIEINCNEPLKKVLETFDYINTKNFIVIKHDYDINIEKILELYATKNRLLYINVPKLIYKHFKSNDEMSKKLENTYGKKTLKNEITDLKNEDGYIYYKYNPIYFEPSLVNEMILNFVNERYKEIENSGNFIILSGYLNNDLLQDSEIPFNLPLLELTNLFELGQFTYFITVTKNDVKQDEDEQPVQLIIEKKKKVVKVDPLDVDGNPEAPEENKEEEQPPEEENPEGDQKFKPEGLFWTDYDGKPRNYVQVLKRLKKLPVTVSDTSVDNLGVDLCNVLNDHLSKFETRASTHYSGGISILKV